MKRTPRKSPRGFTMVEAMTAIAIVAIAGTALLLGLTSSAQSTSDALDRAIAIGMAEQLIDEVLGARYHAVGSDPQQWPLSASIDELNGQGRERYDDTDDFNGFVAQPPEGVWGIPLGRSNGSGSLRAPNFRIPADYFSRWRQEVEVYYVSEMNPSVRLPAGSTSNLRAVQVRISRQLPSGDYIELSNLKRVFAYVPSPQ